MWQITKWLIRKNFEERFLPLTQKGKQIHGISWAKQLPFEIVEMAFRLADLDFIKYIRICDETLAASSKNYPNKPKVPITNMNHETAIGVQILVSLSHKYINFFDLNSPIKGNGSKMVDAILKDFPKDWQPSVVMDLSNGFWAQIKEKHKEFDWI